MSDRDALAATTTSARRPTLSKTILNVAASAIAVAALIWSALFYDASRKHVATLASSSRQATPATGTAQQAPAPAPVTTRTS